jgi:phosphoribosyl 1,2-cyclic phosphate phosphodiesterase
MLRLTVLGCGTSSGVPRIGNDWGACDPAEPRNRRRRASVLVESETTRILVDTGPDLREQLLAAAVAELDAVLWTHDHADHSHGIDDLRQIAHNMRKPVTGYARKQTLDVLHARFNYAFEGRTNYAPIIEARVLPQRPLTIGDIEISCVDQPHGDIYSTGFRFNSGGRSIAYATDFHDITSEMIETYHGVDIWVADALRERSHPTHATLSQVLGALGAIMPDRTILTHMDNSMDYVPLCQRLPTGVEPGYDGMVIELPSGATT